MVEHNHYYFPLARGGAWRGNYFKNLISWLAGLLLH